MFSFLKHRHEKNMLEALKLSAKYGEQAIAFRATGRSDKAAEMNNHLMHQHQQYVSMRRVASDEQIRNYERLRDEYIVEYEEKHGVKLNTLLTPQH